MFNPSSISWMSLKTFNLVANKEWRFIIVPTSSHGKLRTSFNQASGQHTFTCFFMGGWGVQHSKIYLKSFFDHIKWMTDELGTCSCSQPTQEKLKAREAFCSRIWILALIPRLQLSHIIYAYYKNRYQRIAHYKVIVKHSFISSKGIQLYLYMIHSFTIFITFHLFY